MEDAALELHEGLTCVEALEASEPVDGLHDPLHAFLPLDVTHPRRSLPRCGRHHPLTPQGSAGGAAESTYALNLMDTDDSTRLPF